MILLSTLLVAPLPCVSSLEPLIGAYRPSLLYPDDTLVSGSEWHLVLRKLWEPQLPYPDGIYVYRTATSDAVVDVAGSLFSIIVVCLVEMLSSPAGETGGDMVLDAVLVTSTLAALWGWDIHVVIESDALMVVMASLSSMAATHSVRTFNSMLVSGCGSVASIFGESGCAVTLDVMWFVLPLSVSS